MLLDQGQLAKVTIQAYLPGQDSDGSPIPSPVPEDTYVVQINPASYSISEQLNYADRAAPGTSSSDAVYANSPPRIVTFDFVIDATGVVPPPSQLGGVPVAGAIAKAASGEAEIDVEGEIRKFNRVVYEYDGEIHRPRKVRILWGRLDRICALSSLNFVYKLFKPDGTPIRAQASCTFQQAETDAERLRRERRASPDVSHLREIREGDKLPLLAHQVYGDPARYTALARHNKLVNFRNLRAGIRLDLPPLKRESANR